MASMAFPLLRRRCSWPPGKWPLAPCERERETGNEHDDDTEMEMESECHPVPDNANDKIRAAERVNSDDNSVTLGVKCLRSFPSSASSSSPVLAKRSKRSLSPSPPPPPPPPQTPKMSNTPQTDLPPLPSTSAFNGDNRSPSPGPCPCPCSPVSVPPNREMIFPDEFILRELSEMRVLLERLLENRDQLGVNVGPPHEELLSLFGLRPSDLTLADSPGSSETDSDSVKEPALSETFPVGNWEFEECGVCLHFGWLYRRPCCGYPACTDCLGQYYGSKVELGLFSIECINTKCNSYVHRDEVSVRLEAGLKQVYYRLLLASNSNGLSKTCPRCNQVLTMGSEAALEEMKKSVKIDPNSARVECVECQYHWCFLCHSPWHPGITCRQYRKGDRLLKLWAREVSQGQVNAQRCPKCKVFIQRTSGCDHMHCTRCKTDFCYRCGDQLRRLKFFGDHYSKLSVFGCKFRYRAEQPVQRKLIRGAVFGSKLMMAPVLGSLALCAGAVVVGVGVAALPLYGGVRLYRKYQHRRYFKVSFNRPRPVVSTGAQTVALRMSQESGL